MTDVPTALLLFLSSFIPRLEGGINSIKRFIQSATFFSVSSGAVIRVDEGGQTLHPYEVSRCYSPQYIRNTVRIFYFFLTVGNFRL